jgi:hypothetical protein
MIVLVPLPLFSIMPCTGEPGIMIDCDPALDPVTRPGPPDVDTLPAPADNDGAMALPAGAVV